MKHLCDVVLCHKPHQDVSTTHVKYFTLAKVDQKTVISIFYLRVLTQDFPANRSEMCSISLEARTAVTHKHTL